MEREVTGLHARRIAGLSRPALWLAQCAAVIPVVVAPSIAGWSVFPAAAHAAPASDPGAEDVAIDFARAYLDSAVYVASLRAGLHAQVAACVAAKLFDADQAADKNAFYDRYMDAFQSELPGVQAGIAATMRGAFDDVQMTELDTFYRSPAGRKLVTLTVDQVVDAISKTMPACGAAPVPVDGDKVTGTVVGKLSPLEIGEIKAFGASDTGRKFHDFQPTLLGVLGPLLKDARATAMERAGPEKEKP